MRRNRLLTIGTVAFALIAGQSWSMSASAAESLSPCKARLGQKVQNVTFQDDRGRPFHLYDCKGKSAIVVVFLSLECPISTGYSQALADAARRYAPHGVAFYGVCGDDDATPERLAQWAHEYKVPFPILSDRSLAGADAFEARTTPEAFVLDRDFVLRYRGSIDDAYSARLKKNVQVSRHYLTQALDQLLANKPVTEPATIAVGCPIRRAKAATDSAGGVTFYRDVLPILQDHCQECHRKGEVAPFPLVTYRQTVRWADDIKSFTQGRKMPPWKPVEGGPFHGERKLADRDIGTLAAWADAGAPEGNPADAPASRHFVDGWRLGKPDVVLTVDRDFEVGGGGPDFYRYFVLPTRFPEDRYVSAVEVLPSNRRVVHHVIVFMDSKRRGRAIEQREQTRPKDPTEEDRGPGYSTAMGFGFLPGFFPDASLGGWAPGLTPRPLPPGTGYYLPKGCDIILQTHYTRSGRSEKDRLSIGLHFAPERAARRVTGIPVPAFFVSIPANDAHYRVTGSVTIQRDCHLHEIMPHMHTIGREIKVTMFPPDGPPRTLIAVNDWDFNWQEMYYFREPIALKAGTRLDVEGLFDNSDKNPANPNHPPEAIQYGEETRNEMCIGFLGVSPDKPGRVAYELKFKIPGWGVNGFGVSTYGF